jgi:arylsulfatase
MGRVLDSVATLPDADNTLIIYILGDNGSSAEGGLDGVANELASFNGVFEPVEKDTQGHRRTGRPKHYNHLPAAGPGP